MPGDNANAPDEGVTMAGDTVTELDNGVAVPGSNVGDSAGSATIVCTESNECDDGSSCVDGNCLA